MIGRPSWRDVRRVGRQLSWTSIDQSLFALSNLVITVAVARGGGPEGLGRYTVAFAIYLVVLGCGRSLISDPLLSSVRGDDDRAVESAAGTLTGIYALVTGVVVAGLGLLLGRPEVVVVAVTLPMTLLHDLLRYQAFRRRIPALAAALDGGWLLGSLLAWPVVTRTNSVTVAMGCWSAGAALAMLLACPVLRPVIRRPVDAVRWWLSDARGYATPLLLDSIVVAFSSQALVLVLATMTDDNAMGVLRAGQVYFAPFGVALMALGVLAVPALAQRKEGATNAVALRLSLAIAALAALVSCAVLIAEPLLRDLLFAGSITVPTSLLVPLAVGLVLVGASSGVTIVSKARRQSGDIVRSRFTSAVVGVFLLVLGVSAFGVQGAAWALVLQTLWYTWALAHRLQRVGRTVEALAPDEERSRG